MSLRLNSAGGGSVTLQEPNTASNRTLNLPNADGTAVIQNASNNLLMNSGYGSDAVAYGCRAWVNFNGSSGSIRSSGNVSSITRNSTGNYTVNFSTAMTDANYAVVASTGGANGGNVIQVPWASSTPSTTSYVLWSYTYAGGSVIDMPYVNAAVFR